MNARKLSRWIMVALLVALLVLPGTAAAQATRIVCIGTEVKLDETPGVWTYPDGHALLRDSIKTYLETSTCPQVTGTITTVMNGNWDLDAKGRPTGPMWGSGTFVTADGGVWKVRWQGWIDVPDGTCFYRGVAQGVSGSVAGLKNTVEVSNCLDSPSDFTVTILYPDGE